MKNYINLLFRNVFTIFTGIAVLFFSKIEANSNVEVRMSCCKTSDYAVIVWVKKNNEFTIQASTYTALGGWTGPITISDSTFNSSDPHVFVTDEGNAVAIWRFFDHNSNIWSLASATLPFGGAWSLPIIISGIHDVATNSYLTIRISELGHLTATWNGFVGSNQLVFASTGTFPAWIDLDINQITP